MVWRQLDEFSFANSAIHFKTGKYSPYGGNCQDSKPSFSHTINWLRVCSHKLNFLLLSGAI
jgi:hypothetical protein